MEAATIWIDGTSDSIGISSSEVRDTDAARILEGGGERDDGISSGVFPFKSFKFIVTPFRLCLLPCLPSSLPAPIDSVMSSR